MAVMCKRVRLRVEPVQSSEASTDPENAVAIAVNYPDSVIAKAVRVATPIGLEIVPVIAVQTVVGAEPQESIAILHDARDPALKRFPSNRQIDELEVVPIGYGKRHEGAGGICSGVEEGENRHCKDLDREGLSGNDLGRSVRLVHLSESPIGGNSRSIEIDLQRGFQF